MSIDNKYRVHEVAKDFGASTKEITDVLTEYSQTPKNHMQVLEPQELNLIFDYMTKHHPVDNMEEVLSKQAAERKAPTTQVVRQQPAKKAAKGEGKKAEAKKAEPQKKAAPQPAKEEAKQASAEPQKKRDNNKKRHQIGRASCRERV